MPKNLITNKSNFDHHLINLKCVNGCIASSHTTQVSDYINWCIDTIKTLEVNKHLKDTCKNK